MAEKEAKEQKAEKGKAEAAEAKKPAVESAPAEGAGKKRIQKVSAMTLKEIDSKLQEIEGKMGGFQSRYARQLLTKKAELSGQKAA